MADYQDCCMEIIVNYKETISEDSGNSESYCHMTYSVQFFQESYIFRDSYREGALKN